MGHRPQLNHLLKEIFLMNARHPPTGTLQDQPQDVAESLSQRILLDHPAASQLYALLGAALGKKPDG
jgi:hypothetical protein